MHVGNLLARFMTALVLAPALVAVVVLAPPWAWYACVLTAMAVAAFELFTMTHRSDPLGRALAVAMTLAASLGIYVAANDGKRLMTVVVCVVLAPLLVAVFRPGDLQSAGVRVLGSVAGPIYIAGLLTPIALLRRDFGDDGRWLTLLALTFAWGSDTFAYFGGRWIGGPRLHQTISPNKTWAGFGGAMFGALVAAALAATTYYSHASWWHLAALALLAGAVGQGGDLAESLIKRATGVKDSGVILPGHGGMLDRIDALMAIAATTFAYATLFGVPSAQ